MAIKCHWIGIPCKIFAICYKTGKLYECSFPKQNKCKIWSRQIHMRGKSIFFLIICVCFFFIFLFNFLNISTKYWRRLNKTKQGKVMGKQMTHDVMAKEIFQIWEIWYFKVHTHPHPTLFFHFACVMLFLVIFLENSLITFQWEKIEANCEG